MAQKNLKNKINSKIAEILAKHKPRSPESEREKPIGESIEPIQQITLDDIPSDKERLVTDINDCEDLLACLNPLLVLIDNPNYIQERLSKAKATLSIQYDTIKQDAILINSLLLFRLYLKNVAVKLNPFLVKDLMSLDNLKSMLNSLIPINEIPPIIHLNLTDIGDILRGIDKVFPELKINNSLELIKQRNAIKIVPPLFREKNLQPTSSSIVTDTFYSLCIGQNLTLQEITEGLKKASKDFSNGNISLIFKKAFEHSIIQQFGEDTYKVFVALLCYWYEHKKYLGETITVSGDKILEYLSEKGKRFYDDNNSRKRKRKVESLNWLAHHLLLLSTVRVYSAQPITVYHKGKKKTNFSLVDNYLIELPAIKYYPVQLELFSESALSAPITDLHITFKPGEWFGYFDDENNYTKQYGYVHREALASTGLESALLHWLSFKLEQNQAGDFKVGTMLEQIGVKGFYGLSGAKASNLYRDVNKALNFIKSIDDPYSWEYRNPPSWLINENERKPKGWWCDYLNVVIVFKHPQCLLNENGNRREKLPKPTKPTVKVSSEPIKKPLTCDDLRKALDEHKDNPNVSLRKLAKSSWCDYAVSTLSGKLKNNSLTSPEIQKLMLGITHLAEKTTQK
jgi:hypothetical protein